MSHLSAEDKRYRRLLSHARTKRRVRKLDTMLKVLVCLIFAAMFLLPTFLTITNSFMSSSEIQSNYGAVFATGKAGGKVFISKTVNLKFIPDMVTFQQYFTVLLKSPMYLFKFWNSVWYTVPIVAVQLFVAALAAFGFARYDGLVKKVIFFLYVIIMLMPYQVTLVPNYLVAQWLHVLNTRWAILLPGFFSPFAVYLLTKFFRRIPSATMEAAEIDGAGEWQIFTKICLPLCKGGFVSIAILIFIDYWNMVEQPLILLNDDTLHPLSVFLSRIKTEEISLAFAVAVIYMIPPILVFLYGEDALVEGITFQGGIK